MAVVQATAPNTPQQHSSSSSKKERKKDNISEEAKECRAWFQSLSADDQAAATVCSDPKFIRMFLNLAKRMDARGSGSSNGKFLSVPFDAFQSDEQRVRRGGADMLCVIDCLRTLPGRRRAAIALEGKGMYVCVRTRKFVRTSRYIFLREKCQEPSAANATHHCRTIYTPTPQQ